MYTGLSGLICECAAVLETVAVQELESCGCEVLLHTSAPPSDEMLELHLHKASRLHLIITEGHSEHLPYS